MLSNNEIEAILQLYRQENRLRPIGLVNGEFVMSDDFNLWGLIDRPITCQSLEDNLVAKLTAIIEIVSK